MDKLSLEERARWVEGHLATVLENAADPLGTARASGEGLVEGPRERGTGRRAGADHLRALLGDRALVGDEPHWYRAENPFQFLATCLEIHRALASGDPAAFRSRLPVHQDGSCNGLQHYAALGRDSVGGRAVNLTPVPRPQVRRAGMGAGQPCRRHSVRSWCLLDPC